MSRKKKDSGIEWIGVIPEDWKIQNLKSILAERKENNSPVKTDFILSLTNDRGVIPYTDKGDIGNKSKEDLTGYKLAYPNDIVLNSMNVIIGSVGLSKYFGAVSPVYYMLYPRNPNDSVEYFNLIFQTKVFQESLKGYGNGIMEHRLRIQMIKLNTVMLPYPHSKEQQKIANFLDQKIFEIDHILEKTRESIEEYKKYKQSIITEAVTKGLNPDVEMKDSGIELIGEIPKHWKAAKTKHVTSKITDGAHVSPDTNNGKYDFISTVNIKSDKIDFYDCLKTSEDSYLQLVNNGCKPLVGDVLISKDGTVGKTVVIDFEKDFVVASSLVIMRSLDIINPFYLNYVLKSYFVQEQLNTLMKGTGLKRVSVANNGNLLITIPSKDEQVDIICYLNNKCNEIDSLISQKETLLKDLELYKKSLIYECVTGKREV